jgi:hypothetical protein
MARKAQRKSPQPQRRPAKPKAPTPTSGGILGPGAVTITGKSADICWALQLLPIRKLRTGQARGR